MDSEMEYKKKILALDYESQHFEIHPRNFVDIVYNQFWENLASCLDSFRKQLIQEHSDVLAPSCINLLTEKLLQEQKEKLDQYIDKLELYIFRNIMHIHPEAVLPEDKVHVESPCTKQEDEDIDREIEELQRKILQEKAKRHYLKNVISEQNQVKKRLALFRNELEQLLKAASQNGMTKENIEALYSDLEKLVSVVPIEEK